MKKLFTLLFAVGLINSVNAQWVLQNSGTTHDLWSVHFTDSNTGYVVGDSGTILKTSDGGNQWTIQVSGTEKTLRSVFLTSPLKGCIVGDSGTILKTTDGGSNWNIQTSASSSNLYSLHFPCSDTGYAVGYYPCTILRTTNGGTNWTIMMSDSTYQLLFNSVYFTSATTGYVVGAKGFMMAEGIVMKTINGGTDWITKYLGGWTTFHSVHFPVASIGYVVGNTEVGGKLLKTTNDGEDWTGQGEWNWYPPTSLHFINADTGLVICGNAIDGGILKTTNGDLDLTGWPTPVYYSSSLNSVYFTNEETGYVVGCDGTIIKTTNGGGTVGINEKSQQTSLTIFPNPANQTITITTKKGETIQEVCIYSQSGQKVLQGKPVNNTLDVSRLHKGIYIIEIEIDQTRIREKLIVE